MASSIQLLRSTNAQERPFPNNLLEGQPALNFNSTEPGLFFKATDGSLVKIGPVAITVDGSPPNASATGLIGNSVGEMWLDKSVVPPVLKVYDGVQWVEAGSGGGGGSQGGYVRWVYSAIGGETSLSGISNGVLLSYTPGLEEVFVNGVLLTRTDDYSAIDGSSITSLAQLSAGDAVTVVSAIPTSILQPLIYKWTFVSNTLNDSSQTVFVNRSLPGFAYHNWRLLATSSSGSIASTSTLNVWNDGASIYHLLESNGGPEPITALVSDNGDSTYNLTVGNTFANDKIVRGYFTEVID